MKIICKTPVWTGDIDSKSDLLRETGIIGSLRWWTEAILRGMDMFACDLVGDERCPKEIRAGIKKINLYCPACLIFGATGMRRMFRLEINGGTKVLDGGPLNIRPSRRNRGWYLGSGLVGNIELNIVHLSSDFHRSLILLPLTIAASLGGIGAKTQHGYGVVELENCPEVSFGDFKTAIERIKNNERLSALGFELRSGNDDGYPNLKEMFFAKVQFEVENDWWKEVDGISARGQIGQRNYYGRYTSDSRIKRWKNSGSVPIAPAIKNWLRFGNGNGLWRTGNNNEDRNIENWLFGTIKNNKSASKINISCAYLVDDNLWEFRIWGWIPKSKLSAGFDRDGFLENLKQALNGSGSITVSWNRLLGNQTKSHKLKVWREYNSERDTVTQEESDINKFIESLLKNEGGA